MFGLALRVPEFLDSRFMKVARLSVLRTGPFTLQEIFMGCTPSFNVKRMITSSAMS
jgi:hypothetical protein